LYFHLRRIPDRLDLVPRPVRYPFGQSKILVVVYLLRIPGLICDAL